MPSNVRPLALGTRYARDVVSLTVAGLTTQAYFSLRSLDAQVALTRSTLAARDESLGIIRKRAEGGVSSDLELNQAQGARADAAIQLRELERQRELVHHPERVLELPLVRGLRDDDPVQRPDRVEVQRLGGRGEENLEPGIGKDHAAHIAVTDEFVTRFLDFAVGFEEIAGIDPRMANLFTITTVLISIPIAEMCFVYIATLYKGSIELTTAMLFALAFLGEFFMGGVTGIFLGSSGADVYLHDSYFVIAHFHYTFVPIAIIGLFAGFYFWFPKMFGRMMNEFWGKVHFFLTFVFLNGTFFTMHILGAVGFPRRLAGQEIYRGLRHTGHRLDAVLYLLRNA